MTQYAYNYSQHIPKNRESHPISLDKFNQWSLRHMYRTSYGDQSHGLPQPSKSVAYPGYGGYIPGLISENQYGKTFSRITREAFGKENFGENTYKLATTGFNHKIYDYIDHSKTATSYKYGKATNQKNHSCIDAKSRISQTHDIYQDPKAQLNPLYRQTDKDLQTTKKFTIRSGFTVNNELYDGEGWLPHKILDGNRKLTEYRVRYNPPMPFHRDTALYKLRKLPQKEYNYKYT